MAKSDEMESSVLIVDYEVEAAKLLAEIYLNLL